MSSKLLKYDGVVNNPKKMYDFQERFYEMMMRVKAAERSRAASTSTSKQDPREWYLDKNGVIVSKLIESKAASAVVTPQGINVNKVKAIHNFINRRQY